MNIYSKTKSSMFLNLKIYIRMHSKTIYILKSGCLDCSLKFTLKISGIFFFVVVVRGGWFLYYIKMIVQMNHHQYSPYLTPNDFLLFLKLKIHLKGKIWKYEDIKKKKWYSFKPYETRHYRVASTNEKLDGISIECKGIISVMVNMA